MSRPSTLRPCGTPGSRSSSVSWSCARTRGEARRVLKLGDRLRGEVEVDRVVLRSPTRRALERYTGVLYDALDAGSLSGRDWAAAGRRIIVQSALFGPVRADDAIPAYRLSATTGRPVGPLKRHWTRATAGVWDEEEFIVDARSESYRALSPVPEHVPHVYVRVLSGNGSGAALNHFNKAAKGRLASAVIRSADEASSARELVDWARAEGMSFDLDAAAPGEVILWDQHGAA
ncbi:MAG: YaaA family protein [Mycetocola reblochoni]|uniref:YaaA family protein n=1 Tax=Mycetocola reblochoni TaxID=331618 RepID=UPI003F978ED6